MEKTIKIGRLKLEFWVYHKDFRKWSKPWTWHHKALIAYVRFCGTVLNYRLFAFSLVWYFDHKGYELYNIEFIPKGTWGRNRPYWDTWKVKDKKELLKRLDDFDKINEDYSPIQYYKLESLSQQSDNQTNNST